MTRRYDEKILATDRALGRFLTRQLAEIRGDLTPVVNSSSLAVPDLETFEQLESLGYVN